MSVQTEESGPVSAVAIKLQCVVSGYVHYRKTMMGLYSAPAVRRRTAVAAAVAATPTPTPRTHAPEERPES